jgi:GNAT superfamily N-acetyltransferase
MNVKLRPGLPDDAEVCGRLCYEAFGSLSGTHGFPNDFPSADVASGLLGLLLGHPGFSSVVAEVDGRVMGSNFLDERSPVVGVGPITAAPDAQDGGIGRTLMDDVLRRAEERGDPGLRLLQAAYHNRVQGTRRLLPALRAVLSRRGGVRRSGSCGDPSSQADQAASRAAT